MIVVKSLDNWLCEELRTLRCQPATRSYIISILMQCQNTPGIAGSVTLRFANAVEKHAFEDYQAVGDWLFWLQSMQPNAIEETQKKYIKTLGSASYLACHRMLKNQWPLYEELSARFDELSSDVNSLLVSNLV